MFQGFRGHGMTQAVGRYAPRDARRFAGLVPGMAYATHLSSLPVDDPRAAPFFVFLFPRPQQGQNIVPNRDDSAVFLRTLGRVGHPHVARRQFHVRPREPEKLAGAYARPCGHAKDNHTPDMRRGHFVHARSLGSRGRIDAPSPGTMQPEACQRRRRQAARLHGPGQDGTPQPDAVVRCGGHDAAPPLGGQKLLHLGRAPPRRACQPPNRASS